MVQKWRVLQVTCCVLSVIGEMSALRVIEAALRTVLWLLEFQNVETFKLAIPLEVNIVGALLTPAASGDDSAIGAF